MSEQLILDVYPADADGFELSAYISADQGVHNAHRIRYRPMYSLDRSIFVRLKAQGDELALTKAINKAMAKRILEWTLQGFDKSGQPTGPLPISEESMQRLNPMLWLRLQNVIVWGAGGDVDPEIGSEAINRDADALLDAAITGRPVGDIKIENQQGNS